MRLEWQKRPLACCRRFLLANHARSKDMLIAVTGATGFLGRYVVRHLIGAGHRLRCWYRPSSDRTGFDKVHQHIEWLPGDLGDHKAATSLVRGVDAVVHSALQWQRQGGVRFSGHDNQYPFLEANLLGSSRRFREAHSPG